ncbi:SapC protein [Ectothiorhodospira magna]|uniref:SapC protein n=1 Tax=Ectothiorhodospira magna TaxID=867345 RepID=A0A1H9BJV3_9GAMM|nr:SapC family protein [Ectothiorhodospira magna]SEP89264.1 SapC protein [Ectothiorhodospira magna]
MSRFVPLSVDRFGALRWSRFINYTHVSQLHLMPLAAPEISKSSSHLPLTFARDNQGKVGLYVLTGLRQGVNHCLDSRMLWPSGYVPAFARSYPFRLLSPPVGKGDANQRVVCVDMESALIGEKGDLAFFTDGKPSEAVQEVIDFFGQMVKHYALTERAVTSLDAAGLLSPWHLPGTEIAGLLRLDEAKLAKVDNETLFQLHQQGALAIAYAQALSTQQLFRLQALARQHDKQHQSVDLDSLFSNSSNEVLKFN